jgi:HSP20 family molecular chaperone IbpA
VAKVQAVSDNDHIVVRIEMAGLDPANDVALELHDHALDINVQHVEGTSREQVSHRVALPHVIDARDIERTYADGVLEIRVKL